MNLTTGTELFDGVQDFCASIGEEACYALQLICVAEEIMSRPFPLVGSLVRGILAGYIFYNEKNHKDKENFFVNDPAGFIQTLTGVKVGIKRIEGSEYKPKSNEWVIDQWNNGKFYHFTSKRLDTLADSNTVKHGKVVSQRVVFLC